MTHREQKRQNLSLRTMWSHTYKKLFLFLLLETSSGLMILEATALCQMKTDTKLSSSTPLEF